MKNKRGDLAMADPYNRANAAAWAWYMHGEKGRSSVSEVWVSSKSPAYRPSRFRQEALKQSSAQIVGLEHGSGRYDMMKLGVDFGSSLFDSYEIVALSDELDKRLYGFLEEHAASPKKDHAVHKLPSSEDLLSSSYDEDDHVKNSSKLLFLGREFDGSIEDYSYRMKRHRRGGIFFKAFQSWLGLKSCASFSSRVDCADLDIEDDDHVYNHLPHEHHHHHHHHHHHDCYCHTDASKQDHLMLEFASSQVLEVILHRALQSK